MSYDAIDPVIASWCKRYGFTLFTHTEGMSGQYRCIYTSSESECFQISVDEPDAGEVAIHAADVETHLDEELRKDWTVPVGALASALDAAVAHVRGWMERHRAA